MTIASIGTPSPNRNTTSGSATTGIWGTGQTRSAGNLLVALVASAGTTAPTFPATVGNFTQLIYLTGTNSAAAVYTAVATGADAAWSSSITFGTGGCNVIQYILTGANNANPIDTSGTVTFTTTTNPNPTTTGNVTAAGEYAFANIIQYKSGGGGDTYSADTNWVNDWAELASTRDHAFFDHQANPAVGATLSDNATLQAETSGVGIIVVIALAPSLSPNNTAQVSPAWQNIFLPSKMLKQAVLFDYQLSLSDNYLSAGDIAFGATSVGYQSLISPAPYTANAGPAWENQFQFGKLTKQAVLYDYRVTFSGSFVSAGDIALGSISSGYQSLISPAPYTVTPGPAWENRFLQERLTKQAVLYDYQLTFSGSYVTAGDLAFGSSSAGVPQFSPALDQISNLLAVGSAGSTVTITWATNPAPGSKVLLALGVNGATITNVVDNGSPGVTYVQDKVQTGSATYIYHADNVQPPGGSGTYTITVSLSSPGAAVSAGAESWIGLAKGSPVTNGSNATSGSVSTGAVIVPNGGLAFAAFEDNSGQNPESIAIGGGFFQDLVENNGASFQCFAMSHLVATGSQTCTWTLGDSPAWAAAIAAWGPAASTASDPPEGNFSKTWQNWFGPASHSSKSAVLYDYQLTYSASYLSAGDIAFGAISAGYQSLISSVLYTSQYSPAWQNVFLPERLTKQAVLYDYQLTFAGVYNNGSGDIAFGATSVGVQTIQAPAPLNAQPGPAWQNVHVFGPLTGARKTSVLYDQAVFFNTGSYLNPSGDIIFGALSSAITLLSTFDPGSALPGPAWENQFQLGRLTKQAVLYDYRVTYSGNSAAGISSYAPILYFSAKTVGASNQPQNVPWPPVAPGPAWQNFFKGHLTKQSVLFDGVTVPAPFGPFCFAGGEVDTNAFAGTQTETNLYGGSVVDANLYGGTAYAGCFADMQAVNITLGEFNDETINLTITNNGNPFNLAGYGLQALFKTAPGVQDDDSSTLILSTANGGITITSNVGGTATLVIPHADLENTNFTFWRVDVTIAGTQATAMYGTVTMRAL